MKQVVITETNPEVNVQRCDADKYYGLSKAGSPRGFITRDDYDRGNFRAKVVRSLTRGNDWTFIQGPDLPAVLANAIAKSKFTVFEFDTHKELMTWLAE